MNTQQYSSHGLVFMMGLIQHGVKDGDVIKLSEEKKKKVCVGGLMKGKDTQNKQKKNIVYNASDMIILKKFKI